MLFVCVFNSIYEGNEGILDVIIISYIIVVAGLLHYFWIDHAYK